MEKNRNAFTKFYHVNFLKIIIIAISLPIIVIGCGGNNEGGTSAMVGIFVDSPVSGLEYETASQKGITDEDGTFKYQEGEIIIFSIGDVILGQGTAKETMTPIDLVNGATSTTDPTVTNICRLLLSLDIDGDPSNGIAITDVIRNEFEGREIDLPKV